MFLAHAAGYEALAAINIDDGLRLADSYKGFVAAVLCCGLRPYEGGALAQLRARLAGVPVLAFAEDHEPLASGVDVVFRSASELVAYLSELRHLSGIEPAA